MQVESLNLSCRKQNRGYKLEKIEEPIGRDVNGAPLFNKNTIQPENTDTISGSESKALIAAFAKDTGAAAEAVAKLLENPSPEAAAALLAKLDTLLPKDPETAAVIAKAMAEEFGVQIKNVVNDNGASHSDANGQFDGGNGEGAHESPKAKAKREKHEWQQKAGPQGVANMTKVKSGADCPDFMPGVTISGGKRFDHIAFYNSEYCHIKDHVQGDVGGGKVAYNHQAMLDGSKIPDTITNGTWYLHHGDYVAVHGKDKAVVMSHDGKGLMVKSAYESADKVKEIRTGGFQRVFNKEVLDESH